MGLADPARARHAVALALVALGAALGAACNGGVTSEPTPGPSGPSDPGKGVHVEPSPQGQEQLAAVEKKLAQCKDLTGDSFATRYAVPFEDALGYDPKTAANLDLIKASSLGLAPDELDALGKHGFFLSERHRYPTFMYGYAAIYAEDLPLYVSADSILFAVHRSYDRILESVELAALIPDLEALLGSMQDRLKGGGAGAASHEARADADLMVAVALGLLRGQKVAPVAGASDTQVASLYDGAMAASGAADVQLFGTSRKVDFSQFEPRGHYTDTPELGRYFRSMMWLGRMDLRILETQEDGSQVFRRRQLEGAYALRDIIDANAMNRWQRVHGTIGTFVGEPDSMTLIELPKLLADLGVTSYAALASKSDDAIARAIVAGGYGAQRIASQLMVNGMPHGGTLPLSASFALFGQRYVLDSHVFSNLVYSRVQDGKELRMMPDPLDVAFAALSNDQAGALLAPQIAKYHYAPDLCSMRVLADEHGDAYWGENLYNLWLGSLRTLSPSKAIADPGAAGLPAVTATSAWGRRLLGTQLASWAELRHDTLLYAKQSYTDGTTCTFPDAYVDPYPEFYARIGALAERGKALVGALDVGDATLAARVGAYFDELGAVAATLKSIAESQRTGTPLDADQMAFINKAVKLQTICGGAYVEDGWYARLFFEVEKSLEWDPTIADVHTQFTDEAGNEVGRVLHVGTGSARAMVVTVDTCAGPRAYVGLASSYFERVTENFQRLTDETWAAELGKATPPDPAWLSDLVVR